MSLEVAYKEIEQLLRASSTPKRNYVSRSFEYLYVMFLQDIACFLRASGTFYNVVVLLGPVCKHAEKRFLLPLGKACTWRSFAWQTWTNFTRLPHFTIFLEPRGAVQPSSARLFNEISQRSDLCPAVSYNNIQNTFNVVEALEAENVRKFGSPTSNNGLEEEDEPHRDVSVLHYSSISKLLINNMLSDLERVWAGPRQIYLNIWTG